MLHPQYPFVRGWKNGFFTETVNKYVHITAIKAGKHLVLF